MQTKDDIIERVYTDPSGFGSIKNTFNDAYKLDKSITLGDVKLWIEKNTLKKTNLKGYNSYVSPSPHHEYQIDLFFMSDLKNEEQQKFKLAMCAIDSFTRFLTVVPLKSKNEANFLAGLMECFKDLGGKPKVIYADQEGSFNGKYVQQYLKENDIQLIMTLTHAAIVERAIRTVKDMLYKRLEHDSSRPWYGDLLQQVVFVYNFMRQHTTLGMSPNDARKAKNEAEVRDNLYKKAKHNRIYPNIEIGDMVRIYKKKDKLSKQQVSVWSKQRYTVEEITIINNQKFYKTSYNKLNNKLLLRHEILKVPA